jgi:hypothetical protein
MGSINDVSQLGKQPNPVSTKKLDRNTMLKKLVSMNGRYLPHIRLEPGQHRSSGRMNAFNT